MRFSESFCMTEYGTQFFTYNDLFYNLSADELPRFERLLELSESFFTSSGEQHVRWIDNENSKKVIDYLNPFIRICEGHNFTPLLLELALLSDLRTLKDKNKHQFYSFIYAFADSINNSVVDAYSTSMKQIADETNSQPIVTHPDLYSPDNSGIYADFKYTTVSKDENVSKNSKIKVFQLPVPKKEYTEKIHKQITLFLSKLKQNLSNQGINYLNDSLFVLIPFPRPIYDIDIAKDTGRGSPGGVIFFFLKPKSEEYSKRDCIKNFIKSISWLCAESSVLESHAAYSVSEQEKQKIILSYNILHPLKHRLGQLAKSSEILNESYIGDPLSEETKKRLENHTNTVSSVHTFAEFAYLIHFFTAHGFERAYQARVGGNILRFGSTKPFYVEKEIKIVFNNIKRIRSKAFTLELQIDNILNCIISPYFNINIEKNELVRLIDYAYSALFFEIINNFADHSYADNNHVKTLSINIEKEFIIFSNKIKPENYIKITKVIENKWKEFNSTCSTGGLEFTNNLLKTTNSGGLEERVIRDEKGNFYYEVKLILNGLS